MIAKHVVGRRGHLSSRVLLGEEAFSEIKQTEVDDAMDLALSYRVNHVDVATSYRKAQLCGSNWISRHGKPFFQAAKTGGHTADKAQEGIHRSLECSNVDQVDLLQLHNLVNRE